MSDDLRESAPAPTPRDLEWATTFLSVCGDTSAPNIQAGIKILARLFAHIRAEARTPETDEALLARARGAASVLPDFHPLHGLIRDAGILRAAGAEPDKWHSLQDILDRIRGHLRSLS
jgi:hypothetical protein